MMSRWGLFPPSTLDLMEVPTVREVKSKTQWTPGRLWMQAELLQSPGTQCRLGFPPAHSCTEHSNALPPQGQKL